MILIWFKSIFGDFQYCEQYTCNDGVELWLVSGGLCFTDCLTKYGLGRVAFLGDEREGTSPAHIRHVDP